MATFHSSIPISLSCLWQRSTAVFPLCWVGYWSVSLRYIPFMLSCLPFFFSLFFVYFFLFCSWSEWSSRYVCCCCQQGCTRRVLLVCTRRVFAIGNRECTRRMFVIADRVCTWHVLLLQTGVYPLCVYAITKRECTRLVFAIANRGVPTVCPCYCQERMYPTCVFYCQQGCTRRVSARPGGWAVSVSCRVWTAQRRKTSPVSAMTASLGQAVTSCVTTTASATTQRAPATQDGGVSHSRFELLLKRCCVCRRHVMCIIIHTPSIAFRHLEGRMSWTSAWSLV